jgi:hypothetical protein
VDKWREAWVIEVHHPMCSRDAKRG